MRHFFSKIIVALAALALVGTAGAQGEYPSRPVKFIVPFQPGSQPDVTARFVGQKLAELLKQPVVIDNKTGAGGLIGGDAIAKAAPDGYTVGLVSTQHLAHRFLMKSVPYDPVKELHPIQLLGTLPQVVAVESSNPATSMADFIAKAKASPEPMKFGSGGIASPAHLGGQSLSVASGFKATHIPYKGSPESLNALMGGHIDYIVTTITTAIPLIRSGKIRALAVTSAQRAALLPGIPTLSESTPNGFVLESWTLMVVPAQTPKPIVDKLVAAVSAVIKDPDTAKFFSSQGQRPDTLTQFELASFLSIEQGKIGQSVKEAGIVPE